MNWKHAFTSSIGKKLVMGFTGLFLISFLVVHCYVNALIFFNDGGVKFTEAAHFMGTNPIVRILEIGLTVGIFAHIIQGLLLTFENRAKRPIGYAKTPGNKSSKWYSRSMGLLGTLILLFFVLHWYHFWIPNRASQFMGNGEIDAYAKMKLVFSKPWVVIVYILGCISLSFHLMHGFWSAFQTVGLSTKKYKKIINGMGMAFAVIVPLIFILMPLSFYMGWLA